LKIFFLGLPRQFQPRSHPRIARFEPRDEHGETSLGAHPNEKSVTRWQCLHQQYRGARGLARALMPVGGVPSRRPSKRAVEGDVYCKVRLALRETQHPPTVDADFRERPKSSLLRPISRPRLRRPGWHGNRNPRSAAESIGPAPPRMASALRHVND